MRTNARRAVVVGIVLSLVGAGEETPSPNGRWNTGDAAAKEERNLDQEVISAVLVDLLQYNGKDSTLVASGKAPTEILVKANDSKYIPKAEHILVHYRKERWKKLTPEQVQDARTAANMIIQRIMNKETTAKYKPEDKRVRIHILPEKPDLTTDRFDRLVNVYPPGFSDDRRFAAVFFVHSMESPSLDSDLSADRIGGQMDRCPARLCDLSLKCEVSEKVRPLCVRAIVELPS